MGPEHGEGKRTKMKRMREEKRTLVPISMSDLFWGPSMARSEGKRRSPWKRPNTTVSTKTCNRSSSLMEAINYHPGKRQLK